VEPHENDYDTDSDDNQLALEREMDAKYGPRNQQYDMHQRKARDYSHLFVTKGNEDEEEDEDIPSDGHEEETTDDDAPLAMPQMSMKKGIRVFGHDGVMAVKKEMLQLHERKVMAPKHAKELTL
jgi:hypothetical protein